MAADKVQLMKAEVLCELNQNEEANKILDYLIYSYPDDMDPLKTKAKILHKLGRTAEALKLL